MDNLTHSLIGAALGQAGLKRRTGLGMAALVIGANIPDLDAACFFWLDGTEHLGFRRGITHGPIAWLVLPLLLAAGLWWYDRWQDRRGKRPEGRLPVRFGWLFVLGLIGTLSHPLFDWFNTYGIRFLEPFSSQWFYGDTLFIIDVWIWLGLGGAVWFSRRRERAGRAWRWPAISALLALIAYSALNLTISAKAALTFTINAKGPMHGEAIPYDTVIAAPRPLFFWQRDLIVGRQNAWYMVQAEQVPSPRHAVPLSATRCAWPDTERLAATRPDLAAFLFWSRAPFVERAGTGIVFRDARFYDPRARDRFSVTVAEEPCRPIPPDA